MNNAESVFKRSCSYVAPLFPRPVLQCSAGEQHLVENLQQGDLRVEYKVESAGYGDRNAGTQAAVQRQWPVHVYTLNFTSESTLLS